MRQLVLLCGILLIGGCASSGTTDLITAKNHGLVGERPDGYIGPVTSIIPESTRTLIWSVNGQRRAVYERIAAEEKLPREEIEQIAGDYTIRNTKSGNFVF